MPRKERAATLSKSFTMKAAKLEQEQQHMWQSEESLCTICYTNQVRQNDHSNTVTLNCLHLFCKECFVAACKTSLENGLVDKIKCLDYQCLKQIDEEILIVNLPTDLFEKFKRFKE